MLTFLVETNKVTKFVWNASRSFSWLVRPDSNIFCHCYVGRNY